MKINSLTLENFRQFCGKSTIGFSTDTKKKATLIIADNGAGKTTIIESLHWCLYGSVKDFKDKEVINKKLIEETFEGKDLYAKVILNFSHNQYEYELTRKITKTKTSKQLRNTEFYVSLSSKDEFGTTKIIKEEKEIRRFIDNLLNESIFSYFFSKGEQIEELGKKLNTSNNKDFSKAVKAILGFTYQENAIKNLEKISTDFLNNSRLYDNSSEYQKAIKDKADNIARIEELEGIIETSKNSIEDIEKTIENYKQKELNNATLKEKFKRRIDLEKEKKNIEDRIPEYVKSSTKKLTNEGYKLLALKCKDKLEEILKSQKNIDTGIPGITEDTFKHIFEHNRCLCGCDLNVNKEARENLQKLVNLYPPHALGVTIEKYKEHLIDYTNQINLIEEISNEEKKYIRDNERKNEIIKELKQINSEVQNHSDEEVKEIERLLKETQMKLRQAENKRDNAKDDIERLKAQNTQLDDKISNHSSSNDKAKYFKELSEFTYKVKNYIKMNLGIKEEKINNSLKNEINKVFKSIFSTDYEIKIDSDYKISIESKTDSNLEYSTSQEVILAFCFIVSIMNVSYQQSKEEDDSLGGDLEEKYPLIMDAPSSSFDKTRIKSFCKILPECLDQFIILSKDTDGEELKENLEQYIGKEYIFNKIDDVTTSIKEVSYE